MTLALNDYLILSTVLFFIGLIGVIRRKNLLMLFFSTEIMLNAVNIGMAAISKFHGDLTGQMFAFFIIAVAAAEAAIGLGILIALYRNKRTVYSEELTEMSG
jgi:NADH-quinone oxidoreductase subunit K